TRFPLVARKLRWEGKGERRESPNSKPRWKKKVFSCKAPVGGFKKMHSGRGSDKRLSGQTLSVHFWLSWFLNKSLLMFLDKLQHEQARGVAVVGHLRDDGFMVAAGHFLGSRL